MAEWPQQRVKVSLRPWSAETVLVTLVPSGPDRWTVLYKGNDIGQVYKSSYTYSPPTHKGSRIARYHRRVGSWSGRSSRGKQARHLQTRREVLAFLVRESPPSPQEESR